jgi:hypothetical protein
VSVFAHGTESEPWLFCEIAGQVTIPEETLHEVVGHPRSEKRKESFMPVEITGAWVRAERGIGGRIALGVVCAGALRLRSGQAEAPTS